MKAIRTADLELHHVRINAETGPAFLVRDSKELELDNVTTSKPLANMPVIRLESCPGAVVMNSIAFPGTGVFLSTPPGQMKNIETAGNITGNAKKAEAEITTAYWENTEPATEGNR